ncbi:tRNA1(Val) (adenine(37)-N6)-methyltransferase [Pseudotabrizicola alkalilacus]|uniref:Methyltransferase domain-containing protein n=1 Tax=Pseudotabrizicola alkalilacus TaxID=2305252 RepID=A0A411Z503_9RHOB|nr:methyltransferase [Pseudotabrizicola alkalilacus]RGP38143.1 methyltransferase domain-containing protein [Pseudotabrizicola alkalilacus]
MFADADLTDDKFLCGKLNLLQPVRGYRAATDPVLLAAACPAQVGERVLDIGCGAGAASLCLGARVPGAQLWGLEVQPGYAELARRNAARNGIAMQVHDGDLAQMPAALRIDFDHVIMNPPYYPPEGTRSPVPERARAMQVDLPLGDWVQAGARRLAPGGWLTLICGTDGLPAVLAGMAKLGSTAVLPLAPREGRRALRIIVQARKGGRGAFRLLAPFVIHAGLTHNGDRESYTPEASDVLRNGSDLLARFR